MVRIGSRNLKTALAVFVCMVISNLLKLEYPFFVAIAAIISMENSLINSFKAGRNRALGTIIGASVGLVCVLIWPRSVLLSGLGMIAVIYFCNFLEWYKPIPIAGIVYMAVMYNHGGKSPFFYSINRIYDTFIGIVVAIAVNYCIFPPNYLIKIRRLIGELVMKTEDIIRNRLLKDEDINLGEYEQEIAMANELWKLSWEDSKIRKSKSTGEILAIRNVLDDLSEIYHHLMMIIHLKPDAVLNQSNTQKMLSFFPGNDLPSFQERSDKNNIVFNYHVEEVLNLYQAITKFTTV